MTLPAISYATPAAARYYTPAERFARGRLLLALPVALILAAVAGGLYSVILKSFVESIYFRVGSTVIVAIALGAITDRLLRIARVHHRGIAILLGTLVGLVGLWASWVVWVQAVLAELMVNVPMRVLVLRPIAFFETIRHLNAMGTWTFREHLYRGGPLLLVWLVEAMILVLGCTFFAAHASKPALACPACRKTCRTIGGLGRYDGSDTSDVQQNVESGNFDYLLELGRVQHEDNPEVVLELNCCPCGATNVLHVNRLAWESNDQGGAVVRSRPIVEGLLVSLEQVEHVKGLKSRLAELDETDEDEDDEAVNQDDDVAQEK